MATAFDVAQFFISKGIDEQECGISNLKLQKLIYYAQGFHLALYESALFDEELEAWTHGPVVPSVYHKYKSNGQDPIHSANYDSSAKFTDEQINFLNEIYQVFGQYTAWKLRNMTHEESPWQENEEQAGTITKESLKNYFKTRIKQP